MKKSNIQCPTGLNESWSDFPWGMYPVGVRVGIALVVAGNQLILTRPKRWNITLPQRELKEGEVLADVVSWLSGYSGALGLKFELAGPVEVCAAHAAGGALHVLMVVPCHQLAGSPQSYEKVVDALLLSGYLGDDVLASYIAHELGWSDAGRYLPLPALAMAA